MHLINCAIGLIGSMSCLLHAHDFCIFIKIAMLAVMCLQSQHHNATVLHSQIFTNSENLLFHD
jgi:hypothetical protein